MSNFIAFGLSVVAGFTVGFFLLGLVTNSSTRDE